MSISKLYGLIGRQLSHSFSKTYFTEKFAKEGLVSNAYELFELRNIEQLPTLLEAHPNLKGLNVTVPYKEAILPYLDGLSPLAQEVGAVNCIYITENKQLIGYNTDVIGFMEALKKWYVGMDRPIPRRALILGSGGASKSVATAFHWLDIAFLLVSRRATENEISYDALDYALPQSELIVNTTPLGMYPEVEGFPPIPYERLSEAQAVFDLVYNPAETEFMRKAAAQGCSVVNGTKMLYGQANAAWEIWEQPTPREYISRTAAQKIKFVGGRF